MNFKNNITNAFGLILWASATYLIINNIKTNKTWSWIEITLIPLLVFLGIVLFRFENKPLQDITKGFLNAIKSKISKQ